MRTDDWLNTLPPPDPEGEARVWKRLQASRSRPARPAWPRLLGGIGVAAAAAAAALVGFDVPRRELLDDVDGERLSWSDEIRLDIQGEGVAEGSRKDLTVQWRSGTLRAEVAHDRGNHVAVVTEEATVTVVGTVFAVERGPLGTRTWVDRGKVRVECVDGALYDVTAATGAVTCLPTRAGALLGRADALVGMQAEPELVLDTVVRGLGVAEAGSAVEGELLARRVEQEARRDGVDAVAEAARAYVDGGHTLRRDEVVRTAARLAVQAGRCGEGAAWLEEGAAAPLEDRLALARCWAEPDPGRAAELVRAAVAAGEPVPESWRRWLEEVP